MTETSSTSVSVIMPTYNRAEFIGEGLDASLGQLRAQDEVIIVNDGSNDGTRDVLAAYADRVRIIEQENAGKSAALNRALPKAKGDLIWIVDDDDIVAMDARDRLVNALDAAPEAGFAYGRHDRFVQDQAHGERRYLGTGYWHDCQPAEFLCATLEDFFPHQPGMMVRRELYEQTGPFTAIYSEDYDMLVRLAVAAQPVEVPGILFYQRQHQGTRGTAANPIQIERRDQAWMDASQKIVLKYLDELPLHFFVPERELSNRILKRQALLQRAVILARHRLWEQSAREFKLAAQEAADALTPVELELVRRVSASKFGTHSFLREAEASKAFSDLANSSEIGRAIVRAIGRGFVWRAREAGRNGQPTIALQYAQRVVQMWILGR